MIAIIGILVSLLLPAVQSSRASARRLYCMNNLKQIGLAIRQYEEMHEHLPAGSTADDTQIGGPYWTTWTVDILPFIEQKAVYDLWNDNSPLNHSDNKELRETFVQNFLCPCDIDTDKLSIPDSGPGYLRENLYAPGSYRAMSGHSLGLSGPEYWDNPNGMSMAYELKMPDKTRGPLHCILRNPGNNRRLLPVKLAQITDGLSRTLLVGEYHTGPFQGRDLFAGRRTYWAYAYTSYNQSSAFFESRTLIPSYLECYFAGGGGLDTCKRGWGSFHQRNTIHFVYCDGSVHGISQDIDMEIFVAGGTISNGEFSKLP